MRVLRILVVCEFSGVVREAFRARGHDAWSCDLLPSEQPGQHHQCDAVQALARGQWDLVIAHPPPCTYLCNSGVRWLAPGGVRDENRFNQMRVACDFFAALYWSPVRCVCVENPVMHKYARDYLSSVWSIPPFTQSVQPWQFGEPEVKRTCFWLRGLPALKPTQIVEGRVPRVHRASPGPDRWKERSRTLQGVGKAMAEQWG